MQEVKQVRSFLVLPSSDREALSARTAPLNGKSLHDETCVRASAPNRLHIPVRKGILFLSCWLLALGAVCATRASAATCYVVNPANTYNGNGSTWSAATSNGATGAFNAIPSTLVRGAIYYLADGAYPKFQFDTPVSGTQTVELRKAQSYDHCTSTGWNASTMGSSQAVFKYTNSEPIIGVASSYLTINGNGNSRAPGCGQGGATGTTKAQPPPVPNDCGIKIDDTGCTSTGTNSCMTPIRTTASNVTHLTIEYAEALGNNNNLSEPMIIFAPYSGDAYATYTHMFMHNAGCVYIQDGQQNETVTYSYFWGNNSNAGGCHGQASFSDAAESDTTYADNVFRDIIGTSIWTFADYSTTHNNWLFYNNVIWADNRSLDQQEDGIIACINSGTICTNFMVVQNTMVNLNYSTGTVFSNAGGSITFENNLWYGNQGTSNSPGGVFFQMAGSSLTEDYNSFLNSGSSGGGAHDISSSAAPDPFVNWSAGNFNLASANTDWGGRLALAPPFTTDPNGTVRGTDRGAYEYVNATQTTPTITWPAPAAITYGAALSSKQLNATATEGGSTVAGSFTYSPALGTVLGGGSHTLQVTFTPTDLVDYTTAAASVTLVVNPAPQTLTFTAPPAVVVYGASPIALSAKGGASGNPVTFTLVAGPGAVSGNMLSLTASGTVTVQAAQAGNANYSAATPVLHSISVPKSVLTVTANSYTITSTQALPATYAYSFTGFFNGDTASSLGGAATLTSTAKTGSPAGSYPIVITQGSLSSNRYTFSFVNGTLTITQPAVTVTSKVAQGVTERKSPPRSPARQP
jgi:hypothetical protein